jgi:hypothetical protein
VKYEVGQLHASDFVDSSSKVGWLVPAQPVLLNMAYVWKSRGLGGLEGQQGKEFSYPGDHYLKDVENILTPSTGEFALKDKIEEF